MDTSRKIATDVSRTLQPTDVEACHGAHVLRVRLVALLEERLLLTDEPLALLV